MGVIKITYIYSIIQSGKIIYVGSTNDADKRFKQHKKALENGKHTNKTLQKKYDENNDIKFVVLYELNTDNTLIKFFVESLVNSVHKPIANRCIIAQGRNRVILQRLEIKQAKEILNKIVSMY